MNYITKHLIGTVVTLALLFISAGRLEYWQGWVYVLVGTVMFVVGYTVLRPSDELLHERSKPGEGAAAWDKKIVGILGLMTLVMYIVAGLDSGRYLWSPDFGLVATGVGVVLTAMGQYMFLLAQKQNAYFSSVVRIQRDRGHTVCDTGLYRVVRHPAYLALCLQSIGFPLLFSSLWSMVPVVLTLALLVLRTSWEDATLMKDLPGYKAYAQHTTRYRLVPWVW